MNAFNSSNSFFDGLNNSIGNCPLDYQDAYQAQQQFQDMQDMEVVNDIQRDAQDIQNPIYNEHTVKLYQKRADGNYYPYIEGCEKYPCNYSEQQNQHQQYQQVTSSDTLRNAIIISTIGFWLSTLSLISIISILIAGIVNTFIDKNLYNTGNGVVSVVIEILTAIGFYTLVPGLIFSIVGRILAAKQNQIKKRRAVVFSTLGIVFAGVVILIYIMFFCVILLEVNEVYQGY